MHKSRIRRAFHAVENRPALLVALAALGVSFYVLFEAHAFFMLPTPRSVSVDEGSIAAIALRMLRGHMLPYVDGVSQRGPLLYWLGAIAQALGSRTSFGPLRVLALVVVLVACAFTFAAGARAGRPLAGAIAALGFPFVTVVSMGPHAGIAYNGELATLPFTAGALFFTVSALDETHARPKLVTTALAGAFVSLGLLCKQLAGVFVLPIGLWFLCAALSRPSWSARQRRWLIIAFVAGTLAPLLVVVGRYAAAGQLHALVYWSVVYNATVYTAPVTGEFRRRFLLDWTQQHIILLAVATLLVAWGVVGGLAAPAGRVLRRWDENGLTATVALGALASLVAALAPAHPWSNYYLYCVPWFGLLFGLAVERLVLSGAPAAAPWSRAAVTAGVLAPLALLLLVGFHKTLKEWQGPHAEHHWTKLGMSQICRYVDSVTKPGDAIYVWGFRAAIYVACDRRPASRYIVTPEVAGWIPWFTNLTVADEDRYSAPGSRQQLIDELQQSHAKLVIDAPFASMAGRSMTRYEDLSRYLSKHYCRATRIQSMTFYRRRDASGKCPR